MGLIFENDLHDEFGSSPLAYTPYGGADFGEVLAVARAVGNGDDAVFYDVWMTAADRLGSEAESAMVQGRRASARDLFLRASCFYSSSYRPLYGEPVDPRLVTAFRKQIDTFNKGLALSDIPIEPLRIPFENATLPAYLIPAIGQQNDPRPLVIQTNGYDATITDMYFGSAVAASRRGYHCLIFDGPGQGEMLIEHGARLRPDWETVVRAVVDVAVTMPVVDPTRIALSGWSLGGYLAPRAASGEHRLAACIADPGLWSIASGLRGYAVKLGVSPEALVNIGEIDDGLLNRIWQIITNDRRLWWSIVQRGFWVNGVENFRDYLRCVEEFRMDGRADQIRCPMLLTQAEEDPLAAGAQAFFDALRCPKSFIQFTSAEGAGDHCEMKNRSLLNRKAFDWLDTILGGESP